MKSKDKQPAKKGTLSDTPLKNTDQDYVVNRKYGIVTTDAQTPSVRLDMELGGFDQRGELGNTTYRPKSNTKQVKQ